MIGELKKKHVSVWPIVYGILVSLLGYILTLATLSFIFGYIYGAQNRTFDDLVSALESPITTLVMIAIGMIFVALGGLVTSRAAIQAKEKHVSLLGRWLLAIFVFQAVVMFVFGVEMTILGWFATIVVALSIIPLVTLGGSMTIRKKSSEEFGNLIDNPTNPSSPEGDHNHL